MKESPEPGSDSENYRDFLGDVVKVGVILVINGLNIWGASNLENGYWSDTALYLKDAGVFLLSLIIANRVKKIITEK